MGSVSWRLPVFLIKQTLSINVSIGGNAGGADESIFQPDSPVADSGRRGLHSSQNSLFNKTRLFAETSWSSRNHFFFISAT